MKGEESHQADDERPLASHEKESEAKSDRSTVIVMLVNAGLGQEKGGRVGSGEGESQASDEGRLEVAGESGD